MKISDFQIKLNHKTILHLLDCNENSPQYSEFLEEIHALEPEITKTLHPEAVIAFCEIDDKYGTDALPQGTPVICLLATVGEEISGLASEYFRNGDCVSGMIVDAAADDCLFQMERVLKEAIKEECAVRKLGISGRLEVPNEIPFYFQKMIWEKTHAQEELNVTINDSFMMNPVKSNCCIYKLTDDITMFKIQHDCSKCTSTSCKLRHMSSV